LLELDEHFKDNYLPLLDRFFILFDSILKYYTDLMNLIDEINDGVYILFSIEVQFNYRL
jgi:WASH complex subunit strumpellin